MESLWLLIPLSAGLVLVILAVFAIAIGAAPHLHALRGELTGQLPHFPIRCVDEIATYAMAAWFAHLLALPATSGQIV